MPKSYPSQRAAEWACRQDARSLSAYQNRAIQFGSWALNEDDGGVEHSIVMTDLGPSSVTSDDFKLAFRHHAAGVAIITGDDGTGPVAITVSSVFSVSAEPPVLVFSLARTASASPHLLAAGNVVVHLLEPEHAALAKLGAQHGANRFGPTVNWERLPTGEPVYSDVNTWLRGTIVEQIEIGGSILVVVHVLETKHTAEHEPNRALLYHNRRWAALTEPSYLTDSP